MGGSRPNGPGDPQVPGEVEERRYQSAAELLADVAKNRKFAPADDDAGDTQVGDVQTDHGPASFEESRDPGGRDPRRVAGLPRLAVRPRARRPSVRSPSSASRTRPATPASTISRRPSPTC